MRRTTLALLLGVAAGLASGCSDSDEPSAADDRPADATATKPAAAGDAASKFAGLANLALRVPERYLRPSGATVLEFQLVRCAPALAAAAEPAGVRYLGYSLDLEGGRVVLMFLSPGATWDHAALPRAMGTFLPAVFPDIPPAAFALEVTDRSGARHERFEGGQWFVPDRPFGLGASPPP